MLQTHDVVAADLDGAGAVRLESVQRWVDAACRRYLAQCRVLERTRTQQALEIRRRYSAIPPAALTGRSGSVFVSATVSEFSKTSFTISVRLRGDGDDRPLNVACDVSLVDRANSEPHELDDNIRDELIALEHAAQHFN